VTSPLEGLLGEQPRYTPASLPLYLRKEHCLSLLSAAAIRMHWRILFKRSATFGRIRIT
jgi:hypothetical protein